MSATTHSLDCPHRYLNPQDGCWHVQVTQGETYVTGDAREVLTTVLGSCIAACIRDSYAGVGGMNHFLLAYGGVHDRDATRYGVNAMEILINALLKQGADRRRLEAKLFGGASVIPGLSDVGASNVDFARQFLIDEGIALVGGDVRGTLARRIQFWPVTGRARQLAVASDDTQQLVHREMVAAGPSQAHPRGSDVELF